MDLEEEYYEACALPTYSSLSFVAPRGPAKKTLQAVEQRKTVDHNNEHFAQVIFGAGEFTDAMPGVGCFSKQQTPVPQRFRCGDALEGIKLRR